MNTQAHIPPSFNERKAAQAAAYLLNRAGGRLELIVLLKLLYLAERLHYQQYGEPLTGDRLVSMPHGPVLSLTYDHMKGALRSVHGGWDDWVNAREGNVLSLCAGVQITEAALDWLSESDIESLSEIWNKYGSWPKWRLVDFTHTLAEFEDPEGSSAPIPRSRLFLALGFDAEQAAALEARLAQAEAADRAMIA